MPLSSERGVISKTELCGCSFGCVEGLDHEREAIVVKAVVNAVVRDSEGHLSSGSLALYLWLSVAES